MNCETLGYTEVQTRKKRHNEVGIGRRDIDVFAKHPSLGYYHGIEVKNSRGRVDVARVRKFIRTTSDARVRWGLDIRPALVAVRTTPRADQLLYASNIPKAYAGQMVVPTRHRELYDSLNRRLAYGFVISDTPSTYLCNNIRDYILGPQQVDPLPV